MKIPQRIIQTGKTKDLSPSAKAAAMTLKLLHPDWEHLFFDDEDIRRFMATECPRYQAVFDGFRHSIQRIDFFRYLAVFRLGGFYFDLDVFLYQNLSPLVDGQCIFPFEEITISQHLRRRCGIDWEIGNYGFGAQSEHPFLEAVIENCVKAQREPAWVAPMMAGIPHIFRSEFEVLNTTGPGLLTRTLAENAEVALGVTVLFPHDVCNVESWHLFGDYGVHLMDGSWRSHGGYLHRRALSWWESLSQRRLLAESRRGGGERTVASVYSQKERSPFGLCAG
jgi:hypothetical protein